MKTTPERTPERVPDELVDLFFDRALDEGSREKFFGMLRADLSRCAEVAKTQRIISMLREPIEAPDVTARVMERVASQRGFLSARVRRMVTTGRLIAAGLVLAAVLGLAVARRVAPEAFRLSPGPQPRSEVIASGKADAASGVQHMAAVVSIASAPEPRARGLAITLTPGKIGVRTLAHGGGALAVPSGAGGEARFVFVDGACVDRSTSARVSLGSWAPPQGGAPCPGMLEEFIASMAQELSGAPAGSLSGPSAAGVRSVE